MRKEEAKTILTGDLVTPIYGKFKYNKLVVLDVTFPSLTHYGLFYCGFPWAPKLGVQVYNGKDLLKVED